MLYPITTPFSSLALVPEHLTDYVGAVSGNRPGMCRGTLAYVQGTRAVLVNFPLVAGAGRSVRCGGRTAQSRPESRSMAEALQAVRQQFPHLEQVSVRAPFRPQEASSEAVSTVDCYWQIPLPARPPGVKVRNMLARAAREVVCLPEEWSAEHAALVQLYVRSRPLSPETRQIYSRLDIYARSGPGVRLVGARCTSTGRLAGFVLGDFTGLHTAFYMFAFRAPDAPPGTADALLAELIKHAEALGMERLNLGLGINPGVAFFKRKWGAVPFLPCVATTWRLTDASSD